jgi:predicted Zn-dependent protease
MSNGSAGGLRFNPWPILLGLIVAVFLIVRGCQMGPFGRHQIVALNPQQEAQLGLQAYEDVLQESDVVSSGRALDAVKRVGSRLAEAAENPDVCRAIQLRPQKFDWRFSLVRSKQVNAFCLPGGKVVVYTGILPVAKTEAGLATVLGHEIGHALAHHGAERMGQEQLVRIGQIAVAGSIRDASPADRAKLLAVLGAGAKVGVLLPFSRKHESEADHIGLILMAAAGYNPEEAIDFWRRMDKASKGAAPPEFLSTHPSHDRRAADLNNWLPEALALYDEVSHARNQPLPTD